MTMINRKIAAMTDKTWTVAQAKANFSEVVDRARKRGPQMITKNGKQAVVVVEVGAWEKKLQRQGNLADFLLGSPLAGSDLEAPRLEDGPRPIDL